MEAIVQELMNGQGEKVGTLELPPQIFGADRDQCAVQAVVRWQRAKRRAGTHATLTRSMMKGGGKKPFRQKGTGRARAGSIISPTRVGGAVVFGPRPRSHEHRISKGLRRRALRAVLSDKVQAGSLVLLSEWGLTGSKTRDLQQLLGRLGLDRQKVLLVAAEGEEHLAPAAANIPGVVVLPVVGVNVYDLCRHNKLVATKAGIIALQQRLTAGEQ